MRRTLKYIRFGSNFVIFPEPISHNEISVKHTESPISAGFFWLEIIDSEIIAKCYGNSITLKLSSNPEDSELLTKQINQQWS